MKTLSQFIAISFAVAYCLYGSEILFNQEVQQLSKDFLQEKYLQSLLVGAGAGVAGLIGNYIFKRKKAAANEISLM